MKNVVILGASGFVGYELYKMCKAHPNIYLSALSANKSAGELVDNEELLQSLRYQTIENIDFDNIDFIFNCLPNMQMHKLIHNLNKNIRIIDLSIDFRLDEKKEYKNWYNFDHESFELNENFQFGLTEFNRESIKKSKHVANPGCYATSVLVPLIELVSKDAIEQDDIIIDSKSGYSGAGKTKPKHELIKEVSENISTYGVGDHKHIAEINQELSKNTKNKVEVFFAANLIPVERGILSNIYVDLNNNTLNELHEILVERFKEEKFIEVLPIGDIPKTKDVVGTNNLVIGLKKGYKENKICIVSALDNLLKGAAGQAIQNFNVMNDFGEDEGILM